MSMRIVIYALCVIAALVASSVAVFFLYSTVVHRKSLQEFHLSEFDRDEHITVAVDGRLIGGMLAVHSATQYQRGNSVVLVVRAGITRPGLRDARFHYKIEIPSDVDELSFGNAEDVIWRRRK
jgi:hypothetical protein